MIDVLGSIPEFDTSYKAHSPIVVQSLTEGFCHEDKEIGGEGAALSKTPRILKCFTWSALDQGGNPGPRDAKNYNINEGHLESHLF